MYMRSSESAAPACLELLPEIDICGIVDLHLVIANRICDLRLALGRLCEDLLRREKLGLRLRRCSVVGFVLRDDAVGRLHLIRRLASEIVDMSGVLRGTSAALALEVLRVVEDFLGGDVDLACVLGPDFFCHERLSTPYPTSSSRFALFVLVSLVLGQSDSTNARCCCASCHSTPRHRRGLRLLFFFPLKLSSFLRPSVVVSSLLLHQLTLLPLDLCTQSRFLTQSHLLTVVSLRTPATFTYLTFALFTFTLSPLLTFPPLTLRPLLPLHPLTFPPPVHLSLLVRLPLHSSLPLQLHLRSSIILLSPLAQNILLARLPSSLLLERSSPINSPPLLVHPLLLLAPLVLVPALLFFGKPESHVLWLTPLARDESGGANGCGADERGVFAPAALLYWT